MYRKIGILLLFGMLLAAPQALGQWASIPHNPGKPVFVDGFHVIHDDGGSLHAFSAHARNWHPIGLTNSVVLGTGDWTALFRDPGGNYFGYSARLDDAAKAPIAPGSNLIFPPVVDDDVILILAFDSMTGQPEAHAYSAQFNAWSMMPLANAPALADFAITRFAICVRDGNMLNGFSARTNAWNVFGTMGSGNLLADGNVIALNAQDMGMNPIALAFSGVIGNWAVSPIRHASSELKVDHNVALMRADAGGAQFMPCAFSAYNGAWLASTTIMNSGAFINEDLRDNVVLFEDATAAFSEAFGTRPGTNWASLPAGAALIDLFEDAILAGDGASLYAFSGLAVGAWFNEPYSGGGTYTAGTDHVVVYQDTNNDVHAFSPCCGAWAPMINTVYAPHVGDAVAFIETANQLLGYAARWNQWVPMGLPATASAVATGGSIVAHQQTGLGGDLRIWDERRNDFNGVHNAGGVCNMIAGRNVMLFESTTDMFAFSVQRNIFEHAAGATLPPIAPPVADENVGMFIDGAGLVFAFASPCKEHIWYAYPNGTEFQTAAPTAFPGSTWIRYSITASPGYNVAMMLSPLRLFAGTPAGWMSFLWLDLTGFYLMDGPYVVGTPPPPNFHNRLYLPSGAAYNVLFWTQGLIHNGAFLSLTSAPDPFWLF